MSSLRNAVKRRAHKERSQPSERQKYGLLEKHKDYVLRARDFHRKEDTIRKLKEKAATRNPDEFYYKMIKSKTIDGVHRPQTTAQQYTYEEIMLMKTQDIGYVLSKAQSEQKKVERLQAGLHSIDQPPTNKHVYFAEDSEEAKELRPLVTSGQQQEHGTRTVLPKRIRKLHDGAYRELNDRTERAAKLRSMVMVMSMQKELMGKGRKRKLQSSEVLSPSEVPVYKWHQERKR